LETLLLILHDEPRPLLVKHHQCCFPDISESRIFDLIHTTFQHISTHLATASASYSALQRTMYGKNISFG